MDTFHLCLANGPLALYVVRLAWLQRGGRPVVVSGGRERLALGVGLSGYVAVGPMQLFLPDAAATVFGPYVWLLMLTFYSLCLSLWNLLARPRLGIYNSSLAGLRTALEEAAREIDPQAHWSGPQLALPGVGLHVQADEARGLGHVSLSAVRPLADLAAWGRFTEAATRAVSRLEPGPAGRAWVLLAVGAAGVAAVCYRAARDPLAVVQGLREMLLL